MAQDTFEPKQASATSQAPPGADAPKAPAAASHVPYEPVPLLQKLSSSGYRDAAAAYSIGFAFALGIGAGMAFRLISNPFGFSYRKDRSAMNTQESVSGEVHEYIQANGMRFHAVSLGRQPSKPLMLFCHGFPEFWYTWRHLLKHYCKDYDAVAIDMRGYGLTDKPTGIDAYALDVLAADVAEVVKALGHDKCVLVGHDWGAMVCWVVAGMYPHLVERLVCMAGPHMGLADINMTPEQERKSWYTILFQVPYIPELYILNTDAEFLEDVFKYDTEHGPRTPDAYSERDVDWYKWAITQPGTATASVNYYRALIKHMTWKGRPEVWRALKRLLPMPCMAIMGEKDSAVSPDLLNNLDKVAPTSEVHVLADSSHWIPCERHDKVTELMDSFLAKHPPSPPARSTSKPVLH